MAKAVIVPETKRILKKINPSNFFNSKIKFKSGRAKVKEVLPFRVRFINVDIAQYTSTTPAGIGIAIIGVNNYIL
jgi:hypothetical protein